MRQNAPFANLEMVQMWEERLIVQRVALPWDDPVSWRYSQELIKYNKGKCEELQVQARQGRWFFPSTQPIRNAVSSARLPSRGEVWKQWRGPENVHLYTWKIIHGYRYEEPRPFSAAPSDEAMGTNWNERQEIPFKHEKANTFSLRVITHWNRFPRVVMESAPLETLETHLDISASNAVCADPGLRKVSLSYMMSAGPLQSQWSGEIPSLTLQSIFFQIRTELWLP